MKQAGWVFAASVLFAQGAVAGVFDGVEIGEKIELPAFAVDGAKSSPGALAFERIDPYSADAKIFSVAADGSLTEVPRSKHRYFVSDTDRSFVRMYLVVSEDGKTFEGTWFDDGGTRVFHGAVGKRGLVLHKGSHLDAGGDYTCGNVGHDMRMPGDRPPLEDLVVPVAKGVVTRQAIVAVDTDNEWMAQAKIGNNPANATAYLAALFTGMNVFYERDINIRLTQGTTFLRTDPDPFAQSSLNAQLNELGALWRDTPALQAVPRTFVMMLSGKSGSPNSASGLAWQLDTGNWCTSKGAAGPNVFGHYSVTQTFKFNGSTANSDVGIVGHELGHNFGAAHTHCTSKATAQDPVSTGTIDQCFNGDAGQGCYGGPVSCPNSPGELSILGQGSIMSYCNFSGPNGAACAPNGGQVLREFHPTHITQLTARVVTNTNNGCLTPLQGGGNRVFYSGFE